MKAILARAFAPIEQLEWVDWPDPEAGGSCVVIEAEAIGVNYPDGLLVQGLYQLRPELPFIPGMEVAGRVAAVGEEVRSLIPGDRVAGLCSIGGYAQKVAVAEESVFKLPDEMSAEHACALLCGYGTAHHALRQRARLEPGETLCVLGASGLTGLAAVQIGKAIGARVIAVASTPQKRALAERAGADMVLPYENLREALREATGGRGLDVAFDPVGGDSFEALARAMAWRGRLLVVGFASGTIPSFPVNLALVKGFSIVGVFWGSFVRREAALYAENMKELIDWYLAGRVRPLIDGVYPLSDAAGVLARVLGRGSHGKAILDPSAGG